MKWVRLERWSDCWRSLPWGVLYIWAETQWWDRTSYTYSNYWDPAEVRAYWFPVIKNANEGSGCKNEELNLISRTQAYLHAPVIPAVESQKWMGVSLGVSLASWRSPRSQWENLPYKSKQGWRLLGTTPKVNVWIPRACAHVSAAHSFVHIQRDRETERAHSSKVEKLNLRNNWTNCS